jgi:hypothetical protein
MKEPLIVFLKEEIMFCFKCGAEIANDIQICPKCYVDIPPVMREFVRPESNDVPRLNSPVSVESPPAEESPVSVESTTTEDSPVSVDSSAAFQVNRFTKDDTQSTSDGPVPIEDRDRHGFTTFWLVISLIGYVVMAGAFLFQPYITAYMYGASKGLVQFLGLVSVVGIVSGALLLRYKMLGFTLFVVVSLLSLILDLVIGMGFWPVLGNLGNIAIMYGVLQFRRKGKTTWEQLD